MNLHTVPACSECNGGHSGADEEFKAFITIDTSHARPDANALLDSLAGTVGHNPKIANKIFAANRTYAQLGTGVLQPAVCVTFDKTPYEAVIRLIVRGLYWTVTEQILPQSAKITVHPAREVQPRVRASFKNAMRCAQPHYLNKRTVTYKYLPFAKDQIPTIWGICFFNSHVVFAHVKCATVDT
jgi:hypothetical protein